MQLNPEFYERLGARIAALRRAAALSQEQLAERADVGSSYVAHIEVGDRKPTLDVLMRLAAALDVPLWRLITDDRLTRDERARDAHVRVLADRAATLGATDVEALAYIAERLQTASGNGRGPATRATGPARNNKTRR